MSVEGPIHNDEEAEIEASLPIISGPKSEDPNVKNLFEFNGGEDASEDAPLSSKEQEDVLNDADVSDDADVSEDALFSLKPFLGEFDALDWLSPELSLLVSAMGGPPGVWPEGQQIEDVLSNHTVFTQIQDGLLKKCNTDASKMTAAVKFGMTMAVRMARCLSSLLKENRIRKAHLERLIELNAAAEDTKALLQRQLADKTHELDELSKQLENDPLARGDTGDHVAAVSSGVTEEMDAYRHSKSLPSRTTIGRQVVEEEGDGARRDYGDSSEPPGLIHSPTASLQNCHDEGRVIIPDQSSIEWWGADATCQNETATDDAMVMGQDETRNVCDPRTNEGQLTSHFDSQGQPTSYHDETTNRVLRESTLTTYQNHPEPYRVRQERMREEMMMDRFVSQTTPIIESGPQYDGSDRIVDSAYKQTLQIAPKGASAQCSECDKVKRWLDCAVMTNAKRQRELLALKGEIANRGDSETVPAVNRGASSQKRIRICESGFTWSVVALFLAFLLFDAVLLRASCARMATSAIQYSFTLILVGTQLIVNLGRTSVFRLLGCLQTVGKRSVTALSLLSDLLESCQNKFYLLLGVVGRYSIPYRSHLAGEFMRCGMIVIVGVRRVVWIVRATLGRWSLLVSRIRQVWGL